MADTQWRLGGQYTPERFEINLGMIVFLGGFVYYTEYR